MSGRSSGRGDVEHYSDEDGFEEDVLSASHEDASEDFEDNLTDFEEDLDNKDAQYDNVDVSGNPDSLVCADDDRAYDADGWDDEDLSHRHQHEQPAPTRRKIAIPSAVVDNALSSNAASILALAAFDVFFLSLL